MDEKIRTSLEDFVSKLESIRGRHTELVSVLIPAGFNINTVSRQLEGEKSTANNIKSKNTRKNVIDALERIIRYLKTVDKLPENGLAIYSGNTSDNEGQPFIELFYIEPPKPLNVRSYRCDQRFVIEPLKEMLTVDEVYGLLVIDRKDAAIGLLEGKQIKTLRKLSSGVPSKIRAGGQSSQRFHRITEGLAKDFFRRVAENMKELFFDLPKLKGILIGGPVPTKDEFLEEGQLVTKLREKVISVQDLGYADEHGLEMLVELSKDVLSQQEIIREKKLVEDFLQVLGKNPDMAVYKLEDINKAIQYGAIRRLILSKKLDKKTIKDLTQRAEAISAEVEIVTNETGEGEQFWSLGGMGALLRFKI